jgi:CrcB protein
MAWIAVALGGALGSMARHAVNRAAATHWLAFPAGTVIVNITGCFAAGMLAGLVASRRLDVPYYWREFVFVGVLGGFTTFSTFGLDTLVLSRTQPGLAALNVILQVGGGLIGVWLGYRLATA